MPSPYALDFSPLSEAIQANFQNKLMRDKLAMEQGRFAMEQELHPLTLAARIEANRHAGVMNPLGEQEARAALAQRALIDPYKVAQEKTATEAGQFDLGHKRAMAPTQEEMARVQLEQAKRKDAIDQ